jgi:translation initiation factor 2 subunit 2
MEKDYKTMLNRAYKNLPEVMVEQDRFQLPRAIVTRQGRRSVIQNFKEIAERLQRPPEHILKFLLRETATRGNFDGDKVVFQGRFNADSIRNLVEIYTNKYVICPVCGRPDTHVIRDKRLSFLQCDACGARSSIGKD